VQAEGAQRVSGCQPSSGASVLATIGLNAHHGDDLFGSPFPREINVNVIAVPDEQDAFGHGILDYHMGNASQEIRERDDGYVSVTGGPDAYFRTIDEWPSHERDALRFVKGRVLDVGCGAGRVALHLQEEGMNVTGIDNSRLAIEVCRERGLDKARVLSFSLLSQRTGRFDTLVFYGSNFGLFGDYKQAKLILRKLYRMTPLGARILAQTTDPYQTGEPLHLEYHRMNRQKGRMGGQLRLRMRYKAYATPWMNWLLASRSEMALIVEETGWKVRQFVGGGPNYVAVLERERNSSVP